MRRALIAAAMIPVITAIAVHMDILTAHLSTTLLVTGIPLIVILALALFLTPFVLAEIKTTDNEKEKGVQILIMAAMTSITVATILLSARTYI